MKKLRSYLTASDCGQEPAPATPEPSSSPSSGPSSPGQSQSPTPTSSPTESPKPSATATTSPAAALGSKQALVIQTAADTEPVKTSGFSAPMDQRLQDQATAWDSVISATDLDSTDTSSMGAKVRILDTGLTSLSGPLGQMEVQRQSLADASGSQQMEDSIRALQGAVTDLRGDSQSIAESLKAVGEEQDHLKETMKHGSQGLLGQDSCRGDQDPR